MQYRAALIIWLTGMILHPVIYLAVWSAVAAAKGGEVGGFERAELATYFILVMMLHHATFDWHMWENDWRVRNGAYSAALLRPIHPLHRDLAENIVYKAMTMVIMIPAAIILGIAFQAKFNPQPWMIALFIPALVLAFALKFMIAAAIGMIPFWTTRATAIFNGLFVFEFFFSGELAPLELLPNDPFPLRTISNWLPYRWIIAFPAELLMGRVPREQALAGLAYQALWLAAAFTVYAIVWRRGIKQYSAVGA